MSKLRGRVVRTTYLYEDPQHPDRVTSTIQSPEWTALDRAAMLGLQAYEATLCPGCGEPIALAWHGHTEESWDPGEFVCHACTAKTGTGADRHEVTYTRLRLVMSDFERARMGDFDWTKVTKPEKRSPAAAGRGVET